MKRHERLIAGLLLVAIVGVTALSAMSSQQLWDWIERYLLGMKQPRTDVEVVVPDGLLRTSFRPTQIAFALMMAGEMFLVAGIAVWALLRRQRHDV